MQLVKGRAGMVVASLWQLSDCRNQKRTQRVVPYPIRTSDSCKEVLKPQENNGISLQSFLIVLNPAVTGPVNHQDALI